MKTIGKYIFSVVMLFMIVVVSYRLWNFYTLGPWTRDAKIRGEVIQIAAEVPGKLINLPIADDQKVKRGDLLLTIDPSDYQINLDNALAKSAQLSIQRDQALHQYTRRARLTHQVISQEDLETAKTALASLNNQIDQATIAIKKARLDLSRTRIYAPADGYVTNLGLREGNYISPGQSLLALVDANSFYVMAYFEETKMRFIVAGKPVEIIPYNGGQPMYGHIIGIGRAIVDQSASTGEQLLQNVEPDYPWVRLAQRIPVRIAIDRRDDGAATPPLIAGSTCTVKIRDR
ncbi:HlyD family secretion protein [Sodalis sp. dw_96]|uniref:efflux RND transporter periplasmic adaptor subunit n=1 Tax=Sodalis sp. dw_96 TaxID=2719794 RepID=UPI001BD3291A|nr:HlyD family secretion protein [Sodalis sp. dw_96]